MSRRRQRIHHRRRSETERELHAVARPDQPESQLEPEDRAQAVASWWDTWLGGGDR